MVGHIYSCPGTCAALRQDLSMSDCTANDDKPQDLYGQLNKNLFCAPYLTGTFCLLGFPWKTIEINNGTSSTDFVNQNL